MATSTKTGVLPGIAARYGVRALNDVPVTPEPFIDRLLDEDEAALVAKLQQLSYEVPAEEWRPIACQGRASAPPERFIDGSVWSRTALTLDVGTAKRPAILACLGALALCLEGRNLFRPRDQLRIRTVLCLLSNEILPEDLADLASGLGALGIDLVATETSDTSADFEVLRRRTFDLAKAEMEKAERDVLFLQPEVPTAIDGLLERRLTTAGSRKMPVVGVVKRQLRRYVPESHLPLIYDLTPGQRTPAFILETEHGSILSWYLRLSGQDGTAPSYGIVRLTASKDYLEATFPDPDQRSREVSALSKHIFELRHREQRYARVGISLEPIVRVEDELHAVMPSLDQQISALHRALGV